MEKELRNFQVAIYMKDSLRMENLRDMEHILINLVQCMKGPLQMISLMGKGKEHLKMELFNSECLFTISSMGKG